MNASTPNLEGTSVSTIESISHVKRTIEWYSSNIESKKLSGKTVSVILSTLDRLNMVLEIEFKRHNSIDNLWKEFDYSLWWVVQITIQTLKAIDQNDNISFFITCYNFLIKEIDELICHLQKEEKNTNSYYNY
jgi:hypothetical protein